MNEATALSDISELRPGFCSRGHQSLRLAQYVGLVGLQGRMLEVLPKADKGDTPATARTNLLRLLDLSRNVRLTSIGSASHDLARHSLLEIFISAFLDEVAKLVRAGLLRRYQPCEEDIAAVRGRILIERHVARRGVRFESVLCGFDELTADHFINRVIRQTLEVVRPWIESLDVGRRRLEVYGAFAEVRSEQITAAQIDAVRLDRQTAPYRQALDWSKLILRLLSPRIRSGSADAPALIFDMNQVFERAVANLLRTRVAIGESVSSQHTGLHLAELESDQRTPVYGMRPDLTVHRGLQIVAVADTKWSRLTLSHDGYLLPDRDHVYQMQAYASVYPCEEFSLIYPWHSGLIGARPTSLILPALGTRRPVLRILCVDVGSENLDAPIASTGVLANLLGSSSNEPN